MGVNEELLRDQARVRAYDDEAEIERLRARVAELERELGEARNEVEQRRYAWHEYHTRVAERVRERDEAWADVERLTRERDEAREELRSIALAVGVSIESGASAVEIAAAIDDYVAAALAQRNLAEHDLAAARRREGDTMTKATGETQVIIIEVLRPDGSTSMWIGRLVSQTAVEVRLVDATWISDTGRRGRFLAGDYDERAEWEPHPDGVEVVLRAPVLWQSEWRHDLAPLRVAR